MSRTNAPDEEQFILRLPLDVADRVRAVLRETPNARPEDSHMELRFTGVNLIQPLRFSGSSQSSFLDLVRTFFSIRGVNMKDDISQLR